jgi:hypothetical protein
MNANVVTALAGLLGSVAGASAAIAATWISQRSQTRRELAKSEMRKRETPTASSSPKRPAYYPTLLTTR